MNVRFQEQWDHKVNQSSLYELAKGGIARLSIGYFDQWAKTRAAELGLRLVATDNFETWVSDSDRTIRMRATVLLEDVGDAPLIEGEAVEMHNMGLIPYIRQIEHKP